MNVRNKIVCLLFILPMMGCELIGLGENDEKQGLGCFCTVDDDCARGQCQNSTCSIGGIECITDADCACGTCFLSSESGASCVRTCNTAEDCYDMEQCSVEVVENESDGLFYRVCQSSEEPLAVTLEEGLPDSSQAGLGTVTFHFAIRAVIAQALPIQFIATTNFVQENTGGRLDVTLQALSLDVGQTESPREPVGEPIVFPRIDVSENGSFEVDLGEVFVTGAANPISGSDMRMSISLRGIFVPGLLFCGEVDGIITEPIMAPLSYDNSFFGATPIGAGEPYPTFENMTLACP